MNGLLPIKDVQIQQSYMGTAHISSSAFLFGPVVPFTSLTDCFAHFLLAIRREQGYQFGGKDSSYWFHPHSFRLFNIKSMLWDEPTEKQLLRL